jgi:hypothetical protein
MEDIDVADQPYPFTYDGTSLTEDWTLPDHGFDPSNFKDQSSVGVEVTVMGYLKEQAKLLLTLSSFEIDMSYKRIKSKKNERGSLCDVFVSTREK